MTTQVWGLLGSSKIILDRTDGNIWKVTVPFLDFGSDDYANHKLAK